MTYVIALFACLCSAALQSVGGSRLQLAEVELTGPVADVVFDVDALGETRVDGSLMAGESRRLVIPLPVRAGDDRRPPSVLCAPVDAITVGAHGGARFVRWIDDGSPDSERASPGLRSRPRPPVQAGNAELSAAGLFLLGAIGCVALSLLERARLAVAAALVGSIALWFVAPSRSGEFAAHVIVYEGDGASPMWLAVEAGSQRLDVARAETELSIDTRPADARVECRVSLAADSAWELRARGAALYRATVFEPGARRVDRARNRWADFAETWVREEGEWRACGAWRIDMPLPGAATHRSIEGGGTLPGWLASGLPQGPTILIGRLAHDDPGGPSRGAGEAYVRLTNFE